MKTKQTTKLIMNTYPGFHELPKGVRRLLLVSESHFFDATRNRIEVPAPADSVAAPLSLPIGNTPVSPLAAAPLAAAS